MTFLLPKAKLALSFLVVLTISLLMELTGSAALASELAPSSEATLLAFRLQLPCATDTTTCVVPPVTAQPARTKTTATPASGPPFRMNWDGTLPLYARLSAAITLVGAGIWIMTTNRLPGARRKASALAGVRHCNLRAQTIVGGHIMGGFVKKVGRNGCEMVLSKTAQPVWPNTSALEGQKAHIRLGGFVLAGTCIGAASSTLQFQFNNRLATRKLDRILTAMPAPGSEDTAKQKGRGKGPAPSIVT
ncbi:hypothetical protein ACMU_06395 [Actibacterium mucosum KCTC 23349]|uniref:Uncharacterized protein n=1 Tax=Actibacterium mucosum KCTC 23349 TaxID=1454373 RepID=A0A037ZKD7_9RHOB|nr:hypothetical protein [Actibacterium mucosum]KAJ56568.1 hypothetical protein ACMU_06395 [Actibacterium mucosum KCTC 23349]